MSLKHTWPSAAQVTTVLLDGSEGRKAAWKTFSLHAAQAQKLWLHGVDCAHLHLTCAQSRIAAA